jgi:(p)ppGpp synthase/HD superfamily hydrolase
MNRDQFFTQLADRLSVNELGYVQKAYWLVKEAHRKQSRRMTGERYFEHVRRVAFSAADVYGHYDAETITLGLIHDVVEDTFVPPSVIVSLFGQLMYKWALVLSKELPTYNEVTGKLLGRVKLTNDAYYGALAAAGPKPRIVKGCDRIDNLTDFAQWDPERKAKYVLETNKYVLPIIEKTDLRMHAEILSRLQR